MTIYLFTLKEKCYFFEANIKYTTEAVGDQKDLIMNTSYEYNI